MTCTIYILTATYTDANIATQAGNFLRDNVNHTIVFPANITNLVVNSSNITFMMSDVTRPFVYGVDATDNMSLIVRASEALSQALTETTADAAGAARNPNQINGNFTIDGKVIRLDSTPTLANINDAKAANEIIVTSLYVGEYNAQTGVDNRKKVYIKIHREFKLAAGNHGIQIANIGDLAGHTDAAQNLVTTQTFPFSVKEDSNVPTATVVAQSPEQWLITFNRPVDTVTGKNLEDALKIYTKEGYGASPKSKLTMNNGSGAGDYVVSKVTLDDDGYVTEVTTLTKANPVAPLSKVEALLVQFNRDWSVKLQGGTNATDNYWKSGINPFKVVIGEWESSTGVKMNEEVKDVTIAYDGQSPTILKAIDLYEIKPNEVYRGKKATASGQHVFVTMSEPVQIVNKAAVAISNPVTPNLQQDATPAAHNATTGLPRATYRFVKGDLDVEGAVVQTTLAEDDMTFIITPLSTLEEGKWTLYIEQISDDHGNTSATVSKEVTVPQSTAAVTDTKVAWAAFDNHNTNYDYLYVKFTKEMKAYTANGVDATTNYKFRGYDLPQGSQVFVGIENVTAGWDGVTIRMPKTAWDGLAGPSYTTNMTLSSNFESKDGERISGAIQFELTHAAGASTADGDMDFEAIYNGGIGTILGKPVVKSEAQDTDGNGSIDTIEITLGEALDGTTTTINQVVGVSGSALEFDVSGKTWKVVEDGANNDNKILLVATSAAVGATGTIDAAKEIKGTASDAMTIATTNGAEVVNAKKVIDKAGPQVILAKLNDADADNAVSNGDKLILTFSESLDGAGMIAASTLAGPANADGTVPITAAELDSLFTMNSAVDMTQGGTRTLFNGAGANVSGKISADGKTIEIQLTTLGATPIALNNYIGSKALLLDSDSNPSIDLSTSTDITGANPPAKGNNVQIKK